MRHAWEHASSRKTPSSIRSRSLALAVLPIALMGGVRATASDRGQALACGLDPVAAPDLRTRRASTGVAVTCGETSTGGADSEGCIWTGVVWVCYGDDGDPVFDMLNASVCPILLAVDARLGTDLAGVWEDCEPFSPII
jgi:hypothetical protein